jgi:hypothetical protein
VHGHQASPPRGPCLQSQPPDPRLGVDDAGPSNAAPRAVEAPAPPAVEVPAPAMPAIEAPAPLIDEVVATPAVPGYVPMEPMSPALAPPRYWCDFYKEYTSIPHTLEYAYSLLTSTPASLTLVVIGNDVPPLDPWFLSTQATPAII